MAKKPRWRHVIRNLTIRNRDSRRSVFLNFLLRVKELVNSDCKFGFCMRNCIYGQLEMSRILNFDPNIRNIQTLAPKHAISYHMSPPYKKLRHWIPWILYWLFFIFPWDSMVNLRKIQTLGEFYTFLIILRSRNR